MTRRQALSIARDLREAERNLDMYGEIPPTPAQRRTAERLISGALSRLIAADDGDTPDPKNGEPTT